MSSTSKLTRQMTMITHTIFTEFFVTDVTKSEVIINQFIMRCHYHTFWKLKIFINFFDVLFKCEYKYLRNIIIAKFFYKSNWLLRIECIVKTLYVVTKSAGDVFQILLSVALLRVWLAYCGVKDSKSAYTINVTRIDLVWFLKDIFDPFSGSSILIASYDLQYSWWDANDFSELNVLKHLNDTYLTYPCFDVCKDNSLLISLIQQ